MNKIQKIILSILAGVDTTFYLFTPILLAVIWQGIFGLENVGSYFLYGLGLFSTVFRAIKIGWFK